MRAAVLWFLPMALATFTEKGHCDRTCGNVSVPFPFGLDKSCARNSYFVLTCNRTFAPPKLVLSSNIPVFNISVENGTVIVGNSVAYDCYDQNGHRLNDSYSETSIRMSEDWPYTLSDTRNKIMVFGCDTFGHISDATGTFISGCSSYCPKVVDFKAQAACSGLGCCQISIPKGLRSLNINIASMENYTSVQKSSSCGSAFLVDQESFNVFDYKLPVPADMGKYLFSKVVLDWVVQRDMTCKEALLNRSNHACGANSRCSELPNRQVIDASVRIDTRGIPMAREDAKDKTLSDVINLEDASEEEMERVGMVAQIAVKCLDQTGAKRPTMREVAEELARINHELDSLTVEEKNEVTECKVDDENFYSHATSITCE
ncbi:hypothetical protein NL676_025398 [Syzygium grande]|nr:hypothetical protein NL676_025398 [Syzygium grande]